MDNNDPANPRTLTDEEMQEEEQKPQGQSPKVEPTGEQPKPDVQPKPDKEEQEEEQEISQDPVKPEGEEENKPEKPVSRRESKRIEQLLDKLNQYEQGQMQPRRQGRPQGQPQKQPNGQQIIPEGEYDLNEINGMAQQYGERLFQMGLSQAQAYNNATTFATRLEIDAPKVMDKYAFLDESPDNEDFNPGAAGFIGKMYLYAAGYDPTTGVAQNPDLRFDEFVDGFMDVVELISTGQLADSTRNVARKAAQTGVRPGGVTKPAYQGDDPRKMTDEQLDAAIRSGLSG